MGINSVRETQYRFTDDFISKIFLSVEGFLKTEELDILFSLFTKEAQKHFFTFSSESNLLRIILSSFDKVSLLRDIIAYPYHAEVLITLAANSNYLTDIIVRNPEYLYLIYDNEKLKKEITAEGIKEEIKKGVYSYKSNATRINYLRNFKRRYTLLIGMKDLLGLSDLFTITGSLSIITREIVAALFELCYQEVLAKYEIENLINRYTLCGLGKLGGAEINYSSDADFILFFDENNIIPEANNRQYFELLNDTVLLFIRYATELTPNGFLYRVDFRLRPDGKHSPLARTYSDTIRYYETKGEDWERQMLLKLSYIGGDHNLYLNFTNYIQSFIFPATFSSSPLLQVKKMKAAIERRVGDEYDVKHFSGGIRDIEFSIQALQLLNGGREPSLKTGNSLVAISALKENDLLSEEEAETYKNSYIFFRKIEHYLQLMNDTQTHTIPKEGEIPRKIGRFMGFPDKESFENDLTRIRHAVRKIYLSIVEPGITNDENDTTTDSIKFRDRNRALKNYQFLKSGAGLMGNKAFDTRTINVFNRIEGVLLKQLNSSASPDLILDNFARVIQNSKLTSIWYSEFSNQKYFEDFLRLAEISQKSIDALITEPSNAELFLSREVFIKNLYDFYDNFSQKQWEFILSIQAALGLIDSANVSKMLAGYIDSGISKIIANSNCQCNFLVGGLGSYGSKLMTFGSDIDLFFLSQNAGAGSKIQEYSIDLISEAKKIFQGKEIDLRLRPEGGGALITPDINYFEEYICNRARVWEFQALLKLRYIAGDKNLYAEIRKILLDKISKTDIVSIRDEMKTMLKKLISPPSSYTSVINLKKHRGALITIDFTMDYLIFRSVKDTGVLPETDFEDKLSYINKASLLKKAESDHLLKAHSFIKKIEITLQNLYNVSNSIIPSDSEKKQKLCNLLGYRDSNYFDSELNSIFKQNLRIFDEIINL